jgi:hypothetical protein
MAIAQISAGAPDAITSFLYSEVTIPAPTGIWRYTAGSARTIRIEAPEPVNNPERLMSKLLRSSTLILDHICSIGLPTSSMRTLRGEFQEPP